MSIAVLVTGPPGTGKSTIAEVAASRLGAAVLAWDWVAAALPSLPPHARRDECWAVLANLATAQLRAGRPVVLDGVARHEQVALVRRMAAAEGATCVVVATRCSDRGAHRSRIDGRVRHIPGWHELAWSDVERTLATWEEPPADLRLDAAEPAAENERRLLDALAARQPP